MYMFYMGELDSKPSFGVDKAQFRVKTRGGKNLRQNMKARKKSHRNNNICLKVL